MHNYGRTSFHELVGDRIVYRNLDAPDPGLPCLAQVRPRLGLSEGLIPRKTAPEYAQVIVYLLHRARELDAPGLPIQRLIFVGDTHMNDGTAFANICLAGDWTGLAFIGADRTDSPHVEIADRPPGVVYVANRWAALEDFDRFCTRQRQPVDERTAVVVDLDKTAIGARGRNDHVIDQARVTAVRQTVGDLLGAEFDPSAFQRAYDLLKLAEFHPFTADNQDYLAYICLILGTGLYPLETVVDDVRAGRLRTFDQFIAGVESRAAELPGGLREIHAGIYRLVQQGDPTPFKAFRYNEYRLTVERMGCLDDSTPAQALLSEELCLTQEVLGMASAWQARGALLFALSDKPDEASVPRPELAAQGYRAIHRTITHAVGP
jgi:hypothetical protein